MREEPAAGFYEPEYFPGRRYPQLQILTVEELLKGKQLECPRVAPEVTFKKAEWRTNFFASSRLGSGKVGFASYPANSSAMPP